MTNPPPPNGGQSNPYGPRNQWVDGNVRPNPPPESVRRLPTAARTTPVRRPAAAAPEAPAEETPPEEKAPTDEDVPAEFKSALRKANTYANTMHMSKAGLYDQLTSGYGEQSSPQATQYAVANL